MLGNPVSWFHSSTIIATYAIVPLLVYRCPGDALHKLFMNGEDVLSKFTLLLLTVFEGASKAFSITMGGVDAVRNHASNNVSLQSSMGAALICGILSGCGGGMLYSCFGMKSVNWSLQTPAALLSSNIAMFLSISTSALYLILTTPVVGKSTLIPMDEARAVCVLFIVFGLLWCRFGSYCKYPSSSSSDSATESTSQRKTKKSTPAASPEKASPEKKTEDKKSSGGRKRTPSRKSSRSAAMRSSSPSVSPSKGSEPSMRATRYSLRASKYN